MIVPKINYELIVFNSRILYGIGDVHRNRLRKVLKKIVENTS